MVSPPISKAILLMPTLLELIRIPVRSSTGPSVLETSRMVYLPNCSVPGYTSTVSLGFQRPDSSAALMEIAFMVEPGSNTSIIARLRIIAGCRLRRLFGL
ncbi:hypothetical protein D3C78_1181530 [compost metagenome]